MAEIEIPDTAEKRDPIDRWVGLAVVVLATFLGVCNVKDGNIVQKMQLKLVDRNDTWAWFQARNIRQAIYEATADELSLPLPNETPETSKARRAMAERYKKRAASQAQKMEEQKKQAEEADTAYNELNTFDDQFDLCEAALSIAIAMMGVTALTKRWPLFWVGMVPATFGLCMGIAGFAGLDTASYQPIKWFVELLS